MYHYTECGLPNVWLANGVKPHATPYGEAMVIENVEGLHRAIGMQLVHRKPYLTGCEFRFLRKELDLSQNALAGYFGNDAQSVALWEKRGGCRSGPTASCAPSTASTWKAMPISGRSSPG
ncbi:helix-turn-helix domain-containing protein [Azospirillum thiophilum]|uniref:helix-turn-helix domain-containing protein n=1 Tax=Azospirillum thiophilum TaxID=528244 RepID=UPI000AC10E72|nr:hypothetical protein [Azospirillum thiophilum]